MYAFIMGTVALSAGSHYWRVHVDEFVGRNSMTVIGKEAPRALTREPENRDNSGGLGEIGIILVFHITLFFI